MREFYGKGEKPVAESGKEKRDYISKCMFGWMGNNSTNNNPAAANQKASRGPPTTITNT